jgi:hypothetical protein
VRAVFFLQFDQAANVVASAHAWRERRGKLRADPDAPQPETT